MASLSHEEPPGVSIRPLGPADEDAVLELLALTLGWDMDDRHRQLFNWKHRLSPFGVSPGWVAEDENGLAGFRTMMRWEFVLDGSTIRAARAVDTATAPRAQGRGIFRTLTQRALAELGEEHVAYIFNTPNAKSAPGYLSMGWQGLGRVPLSFWPSGIRRLSRLSGARAAGDLWSLPCSIGEDASVIVSKDTEISELLEASHARSGKAGRMVTHKTTSFLKWRFSQCPVGYRVWLAGTSMRQGVVIFRLRRRGSAIEAVIADGIFPRDAGKRFVNRACRELLRATGADYAVALGSSRPRGWLPLRGMGPILTWRPLAWSSPVPELECWSFTTGDLELF